MNCPKCKTQVSPGDIICPSCKLRLVFECPRCKSATRIGSSSCKKCGFVFVKFCPQCNSANYVSSTHCRKCFYNFKEDEEALETLTEESVKDLKPGESEKKSSVDENVKNTPRLVVYIDFLTLKAVLEKYKDEEFRQKVLLNIKTSVKMAFNVNAEFYKENVVSFTINYSKKIGLLEKINKFSEEFNKFNNILNETLGADISYKFAVTDENESRKNKVITQLNHGIEKDIVTSEGAYKILSDEISLIKISPDSYKMVFLDQKPEFTQSKSVKDDVALELILDTLIDSNSEIKAVSLNAPRGAGKTWLLNKLYKKLEEAPYTLLSSQCSALTQITPLGLIQDMFLTMFNLSFVPSKYEKRVKELRNSLSKNLSKNIEPEKIETLINLVYPTKEDWYENIFINKKKTFSDLKSVLEAIRDDNKLIIAVDDLDLIDETSFEFLKYLVNEDFFINGSKFLLTYRNQHSINMYINSEKLPNNTCLNVNLASNDTESTKDYIKSVIGASSVLPAKILNQIILNANGNFAFVEQVLSYFIDSKKIFLKEKQFVFDFKYEDYFVPQTLDEILNNRLNILKEENLKAYYFLCTASLLGGKFTKSLIQSVLKLSDEDFTKTVALLEKLSYITRKSENSYRFKNSLIWTYIYSASKKDEGIIDYAKALLNEVCQRTISSPAIRALLAQITDDKEFAFELWSQNLKLASFIGDVSFYIMCQKQSLSNLEEIKHPNKDYIRNNIFERLGKLLYEKAPKEAIDYLSSALVRARNNDNKNKVIELSGYLIKSSKLAQNYPAIIETTDTVLSIFNKPKYELQRALIKSRKLSSLLNTGNFEEVNTIVNTEINPVLQNWLKRPKRTEFAGIREIYNSWLYANIVLIEALAQQGNPCVFELIEAVEKEIFKDKSKDKKAVNATLIVKLKLATAIAYTIKGYLNLSDEILQSIVKDFSYAIDDSRLVSKWNMIDIFNKVLRYDFEKIKDELFEAVTFANNCSDNFSKNILKTILAFVLLEEGNAVKSLEICAEEMTYFSNEKLAFGALISWYISAKATLLTSSPDKAIEICEKAIKICEGVKINSVYFKVLFQMLMSRSYLNKGELDNAKTYCELAFQDANINELAFLQMMLYALRANIMQDSMASVSDERKLEVAQNTIKIYEKALSLALKLNLSKHHYIIQKELTSFKAYCQLKRIT